ncbi:MAG TPA: hypothetical protein VGK26_02670 [Thermoanaerobaculia bacterium]
MLALALSSAASLGARAASIRGAEARAIAPMSLYHDLVAGDGIAGFQDGEFYRARFRDPAGIAVLSGGSILVVSDQNNNRIRAIHLDDGNRVETLAGTGAGGGADGPLRQATFHQPGAIVAISDHSVLVSDEGGARFRIVDVQAGQVETVAGTGERGIVDGEALRSHLGGVMSLAYSRTEDAVYFSQPELDAVRRFDLKTRRIATVFVNDARMPGPGALAFFDGKLCVADRNGRVLRVEPTAPDFTGERNVVEVGHGKNIRAMAESGGQLYAVQGGPDQTWLVVTEGRLWTPPSVLAESTKIPYLSFGGTEQVGLVADPRAPRTFYVVSSMQNEVLCVRDYRFAELWAKGTPALSGLMDFDFPAPKPPRTFRILLLGDSHVDYFYEPAYRTPEFEPTRIEGMPKRLELMLNTLGAIDGSRTRFEVLTLTRVSWAPLLVWSAYEAPDVAQKFGVDLVLLMVPPGGSGTLEAYLERPTTARGIPAAEPDMEFLLKPLAQRLRNNPAASLIARAKTRGWVREIPNPNANQPAIEIDRIPVLETDESVRRDLLDLYTRPVAELRRGLEAKFPKASGQRPRPRFVLCHYLLGARAPVGGESPFWKQVAEGAGADYLDLTDLFTALRESWYPLSEANGNDHFTPGGHAFFAFLLSHELLKNGFVPMTPAAVNPKPATAKP